MDSQDIYSYILSEESLYQTRGVHITDGYEWKMYEHIRRTILYKNGQLESGNPNGMKPIKNIIKPILNVAYRSEGFDVKDMTLFVDDEQNYYKSFLTKKYNNKWTRANDIDTYIDELVESYVDFGGALTKDVAMPRPIVVQLQKIAFCDQTNMLSAPIAERHSYAPNELDEMKEKGWNADLIDEAIMEALYEKSTGMQNALKSLTPQKYVTVYEVHGVMPTRWLSNKEGDEYDVNGYTRQAQYVTFPTLKHREDKKGFVLWKGPEKKMRYKLLKRDPVAGRALGYGGVEELFEAQVWTTYGMIQMKEMLDAAALMLLKTNDKAFAENNKVNELDKNEILVLEDGKELSRVDIQAPNINLFENSIAAWYTHAQTTGSAGDASLAIRPASGTPFALEALNVQNSLQMHEYRQGKIATFVSELYRDWFLPYIARELSSGSKWLDELSLEEIEWVSMAVANQEVTQRAIDAFRNKDKIPTKEEGDALKQMIIDNFKKKGSKHFLEVFKGEMKDLPMDVEINIVGKQRDLPKLVQGLTNIFRQVFANPTVLANPAMAKIFNQILEAAGMSPADFSGFTNVQVTPSAPVAPESMLPSPVAPEKTVA